MRTSPSASAIRRTSCSFGSWPVAGTASASRKSTVLRSPRASSCRTARAGLPAPRRRVRSPRSKEWSPMRGGIPVRRAGGRRHLAHPRRGFGICRAAADRPRSRVRPGVHPRIRRRGRGVRLRHRRVESERRERLPGCGRRRAHDLPATRRGPRLPARVEPGELDVRRLRPRLPEEAQDVHDRRRSHGRRGQLRRSNGRRSTAGSLHAGSSRHTRR